MNQPELRSAGVGRKPAGAKGKLRLDTVVDVAMSLIREQGAENLSLRAVARKLNVTPMALYRYVADKKTLEALIVKRIDEKYSLDWSLAEAESWQSTIIDIVHHYEEMYRMHPELIQFRAFLQRGRTNLSAVEILLTKLSVAGLPEIDAIHVSNLLHLILSGAIASGHHDDAKQGPSAVHAPDNRILNEVPVLDYGPELQEYAVFSRSVEIARSIGLSPLSSLEFFIGMLETLIATRQSEARLAPKNAGLI